jgi:hypothetical protein
MRHEQTQPSIIDFYTDAVRPALAERLDSAFPESAGVATAADGSPRTRR